MKLKILAGNFGKLANVKIVKQNFLEIQVQFEKCPKTILDIPVILPLPINNSQHNFQVNLDYSGAK